MGTLWRDMAAAFFMGMVVPYFLVSGAVYMAPQVQAEPVPTIPETIPAPISTGVDILKQKTDGSMEELDMEQYLVGVVLAEMPASFEPEALKAQAVAARTYTAKAAVTGGKHGDGSICTDSACCQAYITEADYLSMGGTEDALNRIRSAVRDTSGQVLTYEGELIEATYFSCSGGRTEDAVEVWGRAYPYLVSVDSPGEENARYHRDTVTFSADEFAAALELEPEGPVRDWFEMTLYTEAGSVSRMTICGETFSGTQLRALLGLRSAAFSADVSEAGITVTTKGYGHRVGLSQYGADAMAVQGSGYGEILAHYYPGTELSRLGIDENGELMYHK